MLSSRDVTDKAFTPTQFRHGYDEREVDDYLDEVVETLRHYEGGGRPGPQAPTSAARIPNFTSTATLHRGYDEGEVNAFLEQVVETLRYYERGGQPAPQTPPRPGRVTFRGLGQRRGLNPPLGTPPAQATSQGLGQRAARWLRGDPPP